MTLIVSRKGPPAGQNRGAIKIGMTIAANSRRKHESNI